MRYVSIDELKRDLSGIVREASAGNPVVVTRHKKPLATLSSAGLEHVHVGALVGGRNLAPLFKRKSRGGYLKALQEDRADANGVRS